MSPLIHRNHAASVAAHGIAPVKVVATGFLGIYAADVGVMHDYRLCITGFLLRL